MAPENAMQKCKKETDKRGGGTPRRTPQKSPQKDGPARPYWHEVILYPEDADTPDILARAADRWESWVSILHDQDVEPATGEIKKPHIHLLLKSRSGRTPAAVAKDLRIPAERVEGKDNGQGALAYLTHSTDKARLDGKHLYPLEALRGPLAAAAAEAAEKAKGGAAEGVQVISILDYIESVDPGERIRMSDLARWAAASGQWASFRRAAVIFKACMEEHNAEADARRREAEDAAKDPCQIDPFAFQRLKAAAAMGRGTA